MSRLMEAVERASRMHRAQDWGMQRAGSKWTREQMQQRADDLQDRAEQARRLANGMEWDRSYTLEELGVIRHR